MTPPKPAIKKWIKALRSGEYEQGRYLLESRGKYCCLGVLCKTVIPKVELEAEWGGAAPLPEILLGEVPQWIKKINGDFEEKMKDSLSLLNDERGFTFDEIADLIQLVYLEGAL